LAHRDGDHVSLIEFNAYRTEHDIVLTVSQTWPIPDVEDFTVSPRQVELRAADERVRTRRETNAVTTPVADGTIDDGTPLVLEVGALPSALHEQVLAWVAEDPRRTQASWLSDPRSPLVWALDGEAWSPTGLAKEIVAQATGEREAVIAGPRAWKTASGATLSALAGFSTATEARDWADLHGLLKQVGPGEWTSYGDLAEGSAARLGRSGGTFFAATNACPPTEC
jgi:hypothetical protein